MADKSGNQIIEIRAGTSQQQVLELVPGTPVQPMSVGRMGTWPIDAPGVLDAHAYMYFDGRALFVQSADASNPVKGNGQAISTTWQQIEIPCTLELGKARLVYRMLEEDAEGDEDKTIAQAVKVPDVPPQFRPGAGMFSNRNQPPDSDATRIQSMPAAPPPGREPDPTVVSPLEAGTPAAGVPKMRPAAGMPAPPRMGLMGGGAPAPPPPTPGYQGFGSVQVAVGAQPMNQTLNAPVQSPLTGQPAPAYGMPPAMMPANMMQPNMMPAANGPGGMMGMMQGPGPHAETGRIQTPPEPTSPIQKALAEWKAMPPIRKIILGAFPGVAILGYMLVTDPGPQPRPMQQQQQQQGQQQGQQQTGTTVTTTQQTAPVPTPVYTPPTVATYVAPPPTNSVPVAPTTSASAPPPKKGQPLERQAIDLAMQGQYAKAAELYDQLAVQHPEQPAYKEAARLLRLRLTGP